jgi:hypothetical protein
MAAVKDHDDPPHDYCSCYEPRPLDFDNATVFNQQRSAISKGKAFEKW